MQAPLPIKADVDVRYSTWLRKNTDWDADHCQVERNGIPVVFKKSSNGQRWVYVGTSDPRIKGIFEQYARKENFSCFFMDKKSVFIWSNLDLMPLPSVEANKLLGEDRNLRHLLDSVPEESKIEIPRVYRKMIRETQFEWVNYTHHKIEIDNFDLKINGEFPRHITNSAVSFNFDSCQIVFFEYFGQLYMHEKDIPKKENPADSTMGRWAFSKRMGWKCVKSQMERVDAVGQAGLREAKLIRRGWNAQDLKVVSVVATIFEDESLECVQNPHGFKVACEGFVIKFEYQEKEYHLHTKDSKSFYSKDLF